MYDTGRNFNLEGVRQLLMTLCASGTPHQIQTYLNMKLAGRKNIPTVDDRTKAPNYRQEKSRAVAKAVLGDGTTMVDAGLSFGRSPATIAQYLREYCFLVNPGLYTSEIRRTGSSPTLRFLRDHKDKFI